MLKQLRYFQSVVRLGFLPVESPEQMPPARVPVVRLPLTRGEEPILQNYRAFWKKDNSGYYVEEFAELLKSEFAKC